MSRLGGDVKGRLMGVDINAYIEWDDSNTSLPFAYPIGKVLPMDNTPLVGSKDYAFIGSLSGVWAPKEPLFPCRGLPPNVTPRLANAIEALYDVATQKVSWLTLNEIRSAMAHQSVSAGDLSLDARIVLHMMQCLEIRLGPGRVRLVFGVE